MIGIVFAGGIGRDASPDRREIDPSIGAERSPGYVSDALDLRGGDGIAVLDGVLESGNQKSVAGETVSKLAGVQSVVNHIRIVPPSRLAMRTLHL